VSPITSDRTTTPSEWLCLSASSRIIDAWFAVAVCNTSSVLLKVAWRLVETVRHAIGKFVSHIVVVLVVEDVADVEDHCLIAEVFPPV
jgi:hypothetical protein